MVAGRTARVAKNAGSSRWFRSRPVEFGARSLGVAAARRPCHKSQQQVDNRPGLLLLNPVPGAVDQVAAEHAGADAGLHRLIDAGALIRAPILLARDEAGRDVDGPPGVGLELRGECAG